MLSIRAFLGRHAMLLTRLMIVAGLVGFLLAIGYLAAEVNPAFAVAGMILPLGVLVLLWRIELGLFVMMLSAVFVRFRLPTGTASEIVFSLLICGAILALWVFRMLIVEKRVALRPTPINAPLLAFVVTIFISLVWGRVFRDVFVHEAGSPFVSVAAAFVMALLPATLLLVANLVRDSRWLKAMVVFFLVEGAISLIVSLIIDLRIGPADAIRQLVFGNGLVWINTHGLFATWYVSFALALALFHRRLSAVWRGLLFIYVAGWVYWGFWLRISWLSGWLPALVSALVIAFLRSKRLFALVAIVAVVAGVYYYQTELRTEVKVSGYTRMDAYAANWRVTGKHLLFGTGPAGYASYYMSYFPTEAMASHSNFIDLIAQTGIIGTAFYLWFFSAQLWGSYQTSRALHGRGDFYESLVAAVTGGTVAALVAMGLGDWLLPFAYTQGIIGFDAALFSWLFMGMLWALRHTLPDLRELSPVIEEGAA